MTTLDALPHWHDDPDVYDTLFLAGQRIPGVVTVKVSRKVKIDKKSAKGKNKATITKQGLEPADVTIEIRLLDPSEFRDLQEVLELLEPVVLWKKDSTSDALDIAHWVTSMRGIEAIIVEEFTGPELVDGILTLTVKAIEFHKPAPVVTGGGSGGGGLVIGTFARFDGSLVPNSLVCVQGSVAKVDVNGAPITQKGTFYYWNQIAFADNEGKIVEQPGVFIGTFLSPDEPLRVAWGDRKQASAPSKDATSTPKKSTGDLSQFAQNPNDPPDPADTDTGP